MHYCCAPAVLRLRTSMVSVCISWTWTWASAWRWGRTVTGPSRCTEIHSFPSGSVPGIRTKVGQDNNVHSTKYWLNVVQYFELKNADFSPWSNKMCFNLYSLIMVIILLRRLLSESVEERTGCSLWSSPEHLEQGSLFGRPGHCPVQEVRGMSKGKRPLRIHHP